MNKNFVSKKCGSAREAALLILFKIEKEGAYANLEANKVLAELPENDRRLGREIVYGTIAHRASLDYILNKLLKKPVDSLPIWIQLILRLSLYQLLYLQKIPVSAAVNEGVKLAKKYGHQGTAHLTNAVLRNYLRKSGELTLPRETDNLEDYLSITLSHPRWLTEYLMEYWPVGDIISFYQYNNRHQSMTIRTNTLKTSRDRLIEALRSRGMEAGEGCLAPESIILTQATGLFDTDLFLDGYFQAQDESSMLAAHILEPQPGETVIDLCAAPGGKTTHIAQLMKNNGIIYAFDIHPHKIELIRDNCQRLGIGIVNAEVGDAGDLPEKYLGIADSVLLDAPCSGLGVLGDRPDLRWRKEKEDIEVMAGIFRESYCSKRPII